MSKSDVFHLGLTKNDLQGATLAIVPGDPDRVEKIAAPRRGAGERQRNAVKRGREDPR